MFPLKLECIGYFIKVRLTFSSDGNKSIGPTCTNHFEHVELSTLKVVLVCHSERGVACQIQTSSIDILL